VEELEELDAVATPAARKETANGVRVEEAAETIQ